MDPVARQYEAYPYPARDPADEAKRLVLGSPSHPVELDHFVFGGKRDWTQPFRALVAGGGTGDAAIMLATLLERRGAPAEIIYLDLSTASREIAEARTAARGLKSIRFETGDLLSAPDYGPFDYIDCCGVLHHLPEPQRGFDALAAALSPDGGLGGMVYAPHGRAGVYAMQSALLALTDGAEPQEQVRLAKIALAAMPEGHSLAVNPRIADHKTGDAGLYDLLLHARDTPYEADALMASLERAGLRLTSFAHPARYDPRSYLGADCGDAPLAARIDAMSDAERAVFAERLAGDIKTHVFYAAPAARAANAVAKPAPDLTPNVFGATAAAVSASVAKTGAVAFSLDGRRISLPLDRSAAQWLKRHDGRATLAQIQTSSGQDWLAFARRYAALYSVLDGYNLIRFSYFNAK